MYKFIYNETVKWSTGISSAYVIISLSLDIFLILGSLGMTQNWLNSTWLGSTRIVLDFWGFRFDSTKLDLTRFDSSRFCLESMFDVARIYSIWFKLTLLGSNQLFGSTWFDLVQFGTHLDSEPLHLVWPDLVWVRYNSIWLESTLLVRLELIWFDSTWFGSTRLDLVRLDSIWFYFI